MATLNALLRPVFDLMLSPVSQVSPLVGLTIISLLTAVVMLIVFKWTSNQGALAAVKRQIHAGLFEIRLFNDDLILILKSQFEVLRHNLTYLRLSMAPMLWMIVPLTLMVAQLQFHYGYSGLQPGAASILKVDLSAGDGAPMGRPDATLGVPEGLRVETPALWIPAKRQLVWRIAADTPGAYEVTVVVDGKSEAKSVRVGDGIVRRSPIRVSPSFLDLLLYPAESPLPADSPFQSISVAYPDRDIDMFGVWGGHWLIVFMVLSIAFAFALRNVFGVTI
jgi:hypothetical protein